MTSDVAFVEVEDVLDGTVSLAVMDENVEEVQRAWLEPDAARRTAKALIDAADAIEARLDA